MPRHPADLQALRLMLCLAPRHQESPEDLGLARQRIIWALSGDGDVMNMAFAQSCSGNLYELCLLPEIGQCSCSDIAHGSPHTARQLMEHRRNRALVGDLALHAFGNEF